MWPSDFELHLLWISDRFAVKRLENIRVPIFQQSNRRYSESRDFWFISYIKEARRKNKYTISQDK